MGTQVSRSVGGASRDRTDDLYNAIVALSQLSYGPTLRTRKDTGQALGRQPKGPVLVGRTSARMAGKATPERPDAGHPPDVRPTGATVSPRFEITRFAPRWAIRPPPGEECARCPPPASSTCRRH